MLASGERTQEATRNVLLLIVELSTTAVLFGGLLAVPVSAQPTFTTDVAPIVFKRCAPCHRPGEIGPFNLLTYADVRQRATLVADVVTRRVMPPWKPMAPEPGLELADARALTDAEIATIRQWVAGGAVEGNARDLPSAPTFAVGWQLGAPDLVVSMPRPFVLPAAGADVFRTFVLPIPTERTRYVRALEFRPGNARVVHHANLGVDRTRSSRRLDMADPDPGYAGGMVPDASYPPGYMLGWTPGQRPRPSPDGMPWRLESASDLVVQLHLQPTGKPEPVQVSIGLFFTATPPSGAPVGLRLGSQSIDIPAAESRYVVSDSYRLPVDVDVLAIQPHAHNLARDVRGQATLPDGSTQSLITIADWDFRWQDVYRYERPIALPAGTTIAMRFTYDNSAANPRGLRRPPQRVVWGQNTSDEMGDLWLQLVPRRRADLEVLGADIARKTRADDLAGYSKLMREEPGSPLRHDVVAMLYLQDGRAEEAAAHLRESLRLNSESAPGHYNLGLALSMLKRFDAAAAEFEAAVRIDPGHAEAYNNLGAMRHVAGDLAGAADYYRRAAEIRPDNAEAHNNLGRVLLTQGREAAALAEFRAALAVNPDLASALSGVAWVLATASQTELRNVADAVRAGERAVAIASADKPTALDALAAAYAAAGQFDRAAATARSAIDAAVAAGNQALADQIRQRLAAYQAGARR